jgi:lipopolysaccharide export system protein LptA
VADLPAPMPGFLRFAAALAACFLLTAQAHAEKADREKPINLEADHMTIDDLKKIQTYEGKVVFTQGTLIIRADKIVVTDDAEGFHHGVATVSPGSLAYFREKRDGADEYVEGWGERIEYDSKDDKAELFVRARLKRNLDEVRGNYISYDGKTEYYLVNSGEASSNANDPKGRVHATIQPKKKEPAVPVKAAPAAQPKAETTTPAKPDAATQAKADAAAAIAAGSVGLKPAAEIAHPREE